MNTLRKPNKKGQARKATSTVILFSRTGSSGDNPSCTSTDIFPCTPEYSEDRETPSASDLEENFQGDRVEDVGNIPDSLDQDIEPKQCPFLVNTYKINNVAFCWNMLSCPISPQISTLLFVEQLRNKFCIDRLEVAFLIICNVKNDNNIWKDLEQSQTSVLHASNQATANRKVKGFVSSITERFLTSSVHVVIVCNDFTLEPTLIDSFGVTHPFTIISAANTRSTSLSSAMIQHIPLEEFLLDLASIQADVSKPTFLEISNLPSERPRKYWKKKLINLVRATRGILQDLSGQEALVRYTSIDDALAARETLNGQVIHGRRIVVCIQEGSTLNKKLKEADSSPAMKVINHHEDLVTKHLKTIVNIQVSSKRGDIAFWKDYLRHSLKLEVNLQVENLNHPQNGGFIAPFNSKAEAKKFVKAVVRLQQESGGEEIYAKLQNKEHDISEGERIHKLKVKFVLEMREKQQKLLLPHAQKLDETKKKLDLLEKEVNALPSKVSVSCYQQLHDEKQALEYKLHELSEQLVQFVQYTGTLLESAENSTFTTSADCNTFLKDLNKEFARERNSLAGALPIYAKRSQIVELVSEHQVVVLLAETGSGKSTQLAQYLWRAGLAGDLTIACTQPRKIAAISLAKYVSGQLGCHLGSIVDCKVGKHKKVKSTTKIVYLTDYALLNECVTDSDLSCFSCIIVDEAHERTIYTDLFLGVIKNIVRRRRDLKVIITSATIDPALFMTFFGVGKEALLTVPGRTFPVDVVWRSRDIPHNWDGYLEEAVNMAVEVHATEGDGDILVFLTSPAETEKACQLLPLRLRMKPGSRGVECFQIHGKQDPAEQQKVFDPAPQGKRKIIFATNSAETSITIQGVVYVVDSGMVKESQFSAEKNTSTLVVSLVTRSSAEQRKGRAGRTQPGKCYRLYSQKNFEDMRPMNVPEILRMNLGLALLKIMEINVSNFSASDFQFVESPPQSALEDATKKLVAQGAVEDGRLTELGRKMAKFPLDPRWSRFVLRSVEEGVGRDAIIISALAGMTGQVFFRNEENKTVADLMKVRFCSTEGDFHTFLAVYKEWMDTPKEARNQWCVINCINAKSMRATHEEVKTIHSILTGELNLDVQKAEGINSDSSSKLKWLLFETLKENFCIFSGCSKFGYISPSLDSRLFIHPSSALHYLGDHTPGSVVYDTVLKTTNNYMLSVMPVEEQMVRDAVSSGILTINLESLKLKVVTARRLHPFGEIVLFRLLGKSAASLMALERELKNSLQTDYVKIDINIKKGEVIGFTFLPFLDVVEDAIHSRAKLIHEELRRDRLEETLPVSPSIRVVKRGLPLILYGIKGEVSHLLKPGEYHTVLVSITQDHLPTSDVLSELHTCGEVWNHKQISKGLLVSFSEMSAAARAVEKYASGTQFTAQPWTTQPKPRDQTPKFFSLNLRWPRRRLTGQGRLIFKDEADAIVASASLVGRCVRLPSGHVLVVKKDKHKDDSLFVSKIPLECSKEALKSHLECQYLSDVRIDDVVFFRTKAFESTENDIQSVCEKLLVLFSQYTPRSNLVIKINAPQPYHTVWFARVLFGNAHDGQVAVTALQGNATIDGELLLMEPVLCYQYFTTAAIFNAIMEDIKSLEKFYVTSDAKQPHVVVSADIKDDNLVIIKVNSDNIRDMSIAQEAIQDFLAGDSIECLGKPLLEKLFLHSGKEFMKNVEKETGVVINFDRRLKTVSLVGLQGKRSRAMHLINNYLDNLAAECSKDLHLVGPSQPRGLLRELLRTYGWELAQLKETCGLKSVELHVMRHLLTLHGSEEAIAKVEDCLATLSEQLSATEAGRVASEIETCPICFGDLDEDYHRLELCGHGACKLCLLSQLQAKALPLLCSSEHCREALVLKDLQKILKGRENLFTELKEAAVVHFVQQNNQDYHYCLTADCPVIYRTTGTGEIFQCAVCLNYICTTCHTSRHSGITCEMNKLLRADSDHSLKVWMESNPTDHKLCPKCRAPIEKNGGCNHMTCWKCQTHMCWPCMGVFPTGRNVYDHMPYCAAQR